MSTDAIEFSKKSIAGKTEPVPDVGKTEQAEVADKGAAREASEKVVDTQQGKDNGARSKVEPGEWSSKEHEKQGSSVREKTG